MYAVSPYAVVPFSCINIFLSPEAIYYLFFPFFCRVMFLFSCLLMLVLPTLRLWCADEAEDHLAVFIMLTTAPYFLFFCRFVHSICSLHFKVIVRYILRSFLFQRLQNGWAIRRDDLPHGDG